MGRPSGPVKVRHHWVPAWAARASARMRVSAASSGPYPATWPGVPDRPSQVARGRVRLIRPVTRRAPGSVGPVGWPADVTAGEPAVVGGPVVGSSRGGPAAGSSLGEPVMSAGSWPAGRLRSGPLLLGPLPLGLLPVGLLLLGPLPLGLLPLGPLLLGALVLAGPSVLAGAPPGQFWLGSAGSREL